MDDDSQGTAQRQVDAIVASLRARLGNAMDASVITAEVESAFTAFAGARVVAFVPILVESRVSARLGHRIPSDDWQTSSPA
jgi:hypothetical protein